MTGAEYILSALRARLEAASPGAAITATLIEWRNLGFTRTAGTRNYRATLLRAEPRATAIGESATNRHTFLFQLDIFDPPNRDARITYAEAERIAQCFKRGTVLTASGVYVHCLKAYQMHDGDSSDPAWFIVPVLVRGWADIAN